MPTPISFKSIETRFSATANFIFLNIPRSTQTGDSDHCQLHLDYIPLSQRIVRVDHTKAAVLLILITSIQTSRLPSLLSIYSLVFHMKWNYCHDSKKSILNSKPSVVIQLANSVYALMDFGEDTQMGVCQSCCGLHAQRRMMMPSGESFLCSALSNLPEPGTHAISSSSSSSCMEQHNIPSHPSPPSLPNTATRTTTEMGWHFWPTILILQQEDVLNHGLLLWQFIERCWRGQKESFLFRVSFSFVLLIFV